MTTEFHSDNLTELSGNGFNSHSQVTNVVTDEDNGPNEMRTLKKEMKLE